MFLAQQQASEGPRGLVKYFLGQHHSARGRHDRRGQLPDENVQFRIGIDMPDQLFSSLLLP